MKIGLPSCYPKQPHRCAQKVTSFLTAAAGGRSRPARSHPALLLPAVPAPRHNAARPREAQTAPAHPQGTPHGRVYGGCQALRPPRRSQAAVGACPGWQHRWKRSERAPARRHRAASRAQRGEIAAAVGFTGVEGGWQGRGRAQSPVPSAQPCHISRRHKPPAAQSWASPTAPVPHERTHQVAVFYGRDCIPPACRARAGHVPRTNTAPSCSTPGASARQGLLPRLLSIRIPPGSGTGSRGWSFSELHLQSRYHQLALK